MSQSSGADVARPRPLHGRFRLVRTALAAGATALVATLLPASGASGDTPVDLLHGGSGKGVKVLGHTDLGGDGLNGHVAVLGDHAFVGYGGMNGGYAGIWDKTPKCRDLANPVATGTVKVVSLKDASNPTVVSEIDVTAFRPNPEPHLMMARDVAALRVVRPAGLSYDLLAVALEGCGATLGGDLGATGVNFYDVSDPASPKFLSHDPREVPGVFGTRQVSLAQTAQGRVLAFEANIGGDPAGAIDVVDVTNPLAPTQLGRYDENNNDLAPGSCRPFSPAAGVSVNAAGTRAYAAYYDQGLIELDVGLAGELTKRRKTTYPDYPNTDVTGVPFGPIGTPGEPSAAKGPSEGNSFRFVPNATGNLALATDEDLNPARTIFNVASGPGAGDYISCEALWGGPLYEQATPSLPDREVVYTVNNGCTTASYAGRNVAGALAMVDRGGCGFHQKAQAAQQVGAAALLITTPDAVFMFAPDSALPGDAGVNIPVVMVPAAARQAVANAGAGVRGSLTDTPESWGALRVFDLSTADAAAPQRAVFHSPHSNVLTPGDGLYHAVNAIWDGNRALVAWMSDGLRMVDLADPSAPQAASFYVPPAASDPTGNYPAVPLVVDVEKHGAKTVVSDVNGGLYVLAVAPSKDACKNGGWKPLGFASQGECVNSFDV